MNSLEIVRFKGNPLVEIVLKFPCPQKILMVADGLDFGTGGFGLSEFVSIIRAAGHAVTTAHRFGDANATITTPYNFASAATPLTLANYDQVWLFGASTLALQPAEQTTIATFMQKGGGMFATGDHETIGAGMGANLPRVRSMRNWSGVPMFDQNRHDTVLDHGADSIKQFDDQADAVAQRIYPFFFYNGGPTTLSSSYQVHPVLRHSSGAVDFLPDHAHESECFAPPPFAGNFAGVEEWPARPVGGPRVRAQVAAVSMSAGRFITDTLKPPVNPHSFGAISAYDGDVAGRIGRVVCDATWHHFVNINLNGSGGAADSAGNPRQGLYVGGVATPEYKKIQQYYLNTVRWLAPRGRRNCWPWIQAVITRFDYEIAELQLPIPHPCPWDRLLRIGTLAEEVLKRHWGPGAANEVLDALVDASKAPPALAAVLAAPAIVGDDKENRQQGPGQTTMLPVTDLRRVQLGSLINVLAHQLPDDPQKLLGVIRDGQGELVQKLFGEGHQAAEPAMKEFLTKSLDATVSMTKAILEGQ